MINTENVIPEGCLDVMEEATYVMYAIDDDFHELLESMDIVHEEVFLEGDRLDRIGEFFKNVWAKIKQLFENVINWVKETATNIRNRFKEKRIENLLNRLSRVKVDPQQELGTIHSGTNLGNIEWLKSNIWLPRMASEVGKANKAAEEGKESTSDLNSREVKEVNDNLLKDFPLQVARTLNKDAKPEGDNFYTISNMKEDMRKAFLGDKNTVMGKDLEARKKFLINMMDDRNLITAVKNTYNAAKSTYNTITNNLKKRSKPLTDERSVAKKEIAYYKQILQVLGTGSAVQLNCIKQVSREAFRIVSRAISGGTKLSKEEAEKQKKAQPTTESVFIW